MSASKHILKAAIAGEDAWGCIGTASPLPDPENQIDEEWLPFRFDSAQLNDQQGDPALVAMEGMAPDYGGFAPEIDTLPKTGTKGFMVRPGKLAISGYPMSVPDFSEDASRYPSLLRTPMGRLLSSFMAPRAALSTRTLTVASHDSDAVFTVGAGAADLFIGQFIGRDIGGRREASVVTDVDDTAVTHAPHGPALVAGESVRLAQVWEGTAHRSVGSSLAFKLDYLKGRDYALGCRAESLQISVSRTERRPKFAFTVDAPLIYTDRTHADALSGANVRDIIREPGGREHPTFAGTKPRMGANAYAIDADAILPLKVAGELLAIDEFSINITAELGLRGTFDGLGMGDRLPDNYTWEATIQLSALPSLALDVLADARDNYHLFVLPMGPTGAHGGAISFYGTVVSDLSKLDRAQSYQRVALKLRSASGPGEAPIRLGLF